MIFFGLLFGFNFYSIPYKSIYITNFDKLETNRNQIVASRITISNFYNSIKEKKIYSQFGEDGVIVSLLSLLNLPKRSGSFVEFGTQNGSECNTRYLREILEWKGLMMDGSFEDLSINLYKEKVLYSNVLELFRKYNVTKDLDILSEDTDYADFWIIEEILKEYRPKIIIHEVNQQLPDICVTVPKPNTKELLFWESGSSFHGASTCAFFCLAKMNDYSMVILSLKYKNLIFEIFY